MGGGGGEQRRGRNGKENTYRKSIGVRSCHDVSNNVCSDERVFSELY